MSNRAERAQQRVIDEKLEEMLEWYVINSGGKTPLLAIDKKTYRGIVMRWYEPVLPEIDNPVLIEEALGDSWSLRIDPMQGVRPVLST